MNFFGSRDSQSMDGPLNDETIKLRELVHKRDEMVTSLQEANEAKEGINAELTSQISDMRKKIDAMNAGIAELQHQNKLADDITSGLRDDLQACELEINALKTNKDALHHQLLFKDLRIAEDASLHTEQLKAHVKAIEQGDYIANGLRQRLIDAYEKKDAIVESKDQEINKLNGMLSKLQQQISASESEGEVRINKLRGLVAQSRFLLKQVAQAAKEKDATLAIISAKDKQISAQNAEIAALKADMPSTNKDPISRQGGRGGRGGRGSRGDSNLTRRHHDEWDVSGSDTLSSWDPYAGDGWDDAIPSGDNIEAIEANSTEVSNSREFTLGDDSIVEGKAEVDVVRATWAADAGGSWEDMTTADPNVNDAHEKDNFMSDYEEELAYHDAYYAALDDPEPRSAVVDAHWEPAAGTGEATEW